MPELFVSVEKWIAGVQALAEGPNGQGLFAEEPHEVGGEVDEEFFDLPLDFDQSLDGSAISLCEEEFIIEGFLNGFPRGGAGASNSTSRKRQVSQLVEMLQNWGEEYEASQNPDDDAVPKAVQELKTKLQTWGNAPPSKQEVLTMLQDMVKKLQDGHGADGKGATGKGKASKAEAASSGSPAASAIFL